MSVLEMSPDTGVVVTGGGSGIGRACARALAEVGRPVSLWDLNAEGAAEAAASIAANCGVATHSLGLDVTDGAAVAEAVDGAREALGTIGGLVHAAGIVASMDIDHLTEETWDSVLGVNLRAEAFVAQALLGDLRSHEGSAIVGIGSIMSVVGSASIPSYTASKHGVVGLTKSLANHLGPDSIRVNAVCPGYIETPMTAAMMDDAPSKAACVEKAPLGRVGTPTDIARAVRFLMSDQAGFVTGTTLIVDGGVTSHD
ncbi:SDR family NAD(P)-dependent oxidoreductase [Candidatus Poriferisocius sp.]|uniref:SDR family NAD(P)-dependent oxidoreductase n=1 Tax=Candidatus Poriferisocius sp. TaxID=3101276 RepID=UPI003B01CA9D